MFMPFNNTNQLNELNKKVDELIRQNNELKNRIGAIEKKLKIKVFFNILIIIYKNIKKIN